MRRPALLLAVAAVMVLFATAACGDDEPSEEEARDEVCQEADELRSDLQAITDVDFAQVSASDVQDAVDVVVDDVDGLADAAGEVASGAMDDLRAAVDGLESAVADLDGEGSLQTRVRAVVDAGQGVVTAVGGLTDDAGC
jgi:hypothetical protein